MHTSRARAIRVRTLSTRLLQSASALDRMSGAEQQSRSSLRDVVSAAKTRLSPLALPLRGCRIALLTHTTPGCQHALAGELAGRQTECCSIESCGVVQQTLHKRLQHRLFVHLTPGSKAHATLVQVAKTTFCCERYESVTSTTGSLLQLLAIPGMHSFQASVRSPCRWRWM